MPSNWRYLLSFLILSIHILCINATNNPIPVPILPPDIQQTLGTGFTSTYSFKNGGAAADDIGFGPFIDILVPYNGVDGNYGLATVDGISPSPSVTSPNVLINGNAAPNLVVTTIPTGGTGSACVNHPWAKDPTHAPLQVCGNKNERLRKML